MNDLVQASVPSNYNTGFTAADANGFTPGGTINLQLVGPNGTVASNYVLTASGGTFGDIINELNTNMGGTVTFALDSNGALSATPAANYSNYQIKVVSDSTSRGATGTSLSALFGIGSPYTANAANGLSVSSAVSSDKSKLAFGELDTGGAVGDIVLSASDNRGALALADVANKSISYQNFGNLKSVSTTLSQYGATILSDIGTQANQSGQLSTDAKSLLGEINQRQSDASGVNLDEELSNMIVYQNAYAAAGRVIKAAQDIYDVLLQTMN